MNLNEWLGGRIFGFVHGHNLVYNTCWEDPRLDRAALDLQADSNVLVITSAGCNALDYALTEPNHVYAVDMNPRQNALLELKLAGIKSLEYDDFFAMFGRGRLDNAGNIYSQALRDKLSPRSQLYWDRRIAFFEMGNRRPFYFRGTSGVMAYGLNWYVDHIAGLRPWVEAILDTESSGQRRSIYEEHIRDRLWTRGMRFLLSRDSLLSLGGIPREQRRQVEMHYQGGIVQFIRDCVEAVFVRLSLADNYFWRVYITGEYTPECCPEYLKPDNFQRLKDGLADRVSAHTDTVQGFLEKHDEPISRFVLLDHMDWLAGKLFPLLESEWHWIIRRSAPDTRIIWRSGGLRTDFVNRAQVSIDGRRRAVGELLTYHRELAHQLHQQCRVHTYGSFHIADLAV